MCKLLNLDAGIPPSGKIFCLLCVAEVSILLGVHSLDYMKSKETWIKAYSPMVCMPCLSIASVCFSLVCGYTIFPQMI